MITVGAVGSRVGGSVVVVVGTEVSKPGRHVHDRGSTGTRTVEGNEPKGPHTEVWFKLVSSGETENGERRTETS